MTAKTFYTYQELTRRSTEQLVRIYERLFNTDIAADFFNPYQSRQEILLVLFAEMNAQQIVAQFTDEDRSAEPYKALKIVVSEDGMAIIWNTGEFQVTGRKVTDAQMHLIRQLRADGESMQWIADALMIGKKVVFEVLSGRYATTANRWNTSADAPDQKRPVRKARSNFSAARQSKRVYVETSARRNHEFWTNLGL